MKKISLRLKDKGYKVWMEKDDNQSYPEHLIEAVENSAVVLIGISRKYKQTPSVFAGMFLSPNILAFSGLQVQITEALWC